MELFDIIRNIFEKGEQLTKDDLKDYSPYIVNRAFSQYKDLIFFANELNQMIIDKDMHYTFSYNAISKKKRFAKWNKNSDDKDKLELIKEYYGYSTQKAKEVLPLLQNHIDELRLALAKGGRSKK